MVQAPSSICVMMPRSLAQGEELFQMRREVGRRPFRGPPYLCCGDPVVSESLEHLAVSGKLKDSEKSTNATPQKSPRDTEDTEKNTWDRHRLNADGRRRRLIRGSLSLFFSPCPPCLRGELPSVLQASDIALPDFAVLL